MDNLESLNRTFMELKSLIAQMDKMPPYRLNRTFMELKFFFLLHSVCSFVS